MGRMNALAIHGGAQAARRAPWPTWPEHGEPERAALAARARERQLGRVPEPEHRGARVRRGVLALHRRARSRVPCANGTFSLMLALQAARVPPGSEVITSAYTFVGTAGGIVAAGCVPVLVDVDAETYCVDPRAVEAAVTPRTAALMPVHLACTLADMDALGEIAQRGTHCSWSRTARTRTARSGAAAARARSATSARSRCRARSSYRRRGRRSHDERPTYAARLASLVNCGRKEPGADAFPEQMLGHNLRMTEWQAALLRAQLERLPEQSARRERNLARFERALAALPACARCARDPRVTARAALSVRAALRPGRVRGRAARPRDPGAARRGRALLRPLLHAARRGSALRARPTHERRGALRRPLRPGGLPRRAPRRLRRVDLAAARAVPGQRVRRRRHASRRSRASGSTPRSCAPGPRRAR